MSGDGTGPDSGAGGGNGGKIEKGKGGITGAGRRHGVVLKSRYNRFGFDRTTWYAIDYDRLSELVGELEPGAIPCLNSSGGEAGGS